VQTTFIHTRFDDDTRARQGVQALVDAGFPTHDIDLSQQTDGAERPLQLRHRTDAFRVGLAGLALGASAGAIAGNLLSQMTPRISFFAHLADTLSSTPWVAAIECAALGAVVFGLMGTIVGLGHEHQEPVAVAPGGRISVGVHADRQLEQSAVRALKRVSVHPVQIQDDP